MGHILVDMVLLHVRAIFCKITKKGKNNKKKGISSKLGMPQFHSRATFSSLLVLCSGNWIAANRITSCVDNIRFT